MAPPLVRPEGSAGHTLLELVLVLAILSIGFVAAGLGLTEMVRVQEARGAAQEWEAASAWAELGVLWNGGTTEVAHGREGLRVSHSARACGGEVVPALTAVQSRANISRWMRSGGVGVRYSGLFASPDAGGSIVFGGSGWGSRVVVRPESGLTRRVKP